MVVRLPLLLLPHPPSLACSQSLPTLSSARPPYWFASSRREGLRAEVRGNKWAAGGGGERLGLGVSRSPGDLGVAGRRRGLSSCPHLTVEASRSPACTHMHVLGTSGTSPGMGRECLVLLTPNPEVQSPGCQLPENARWRSR